jgi:chemotaxis protein methyltransferase WspC
MTEVEYLLREGIGLDAASIGSSSIQRTVRLRIKSLGLKSPEQYQRLLQTSRAEWTELVESVVVTETWFFRDQEPFAALVRLIQGEWLPTHPTESLRLLSIPCSSGEEPYSLAMALLEAGVPAERFHVQATDISERALAKARRGVYGRNSFRGKDLSFRDRWFQPVKDGYALAPEARRCVRFTQANLLDSMFLAGQPAYDFIFCRNLLIYFDALTRRKALERIQRLLSPAGVLFVGAAEQPLVLDHGFVSANLPMAFACRKVEAGKAALKVPPPMRASKLAGRALVPNARGPRSPEPATSPKAPSSLTPSLSQANREKLQGPGGVDQAVAPSRLKALIPTAPPRRSAQASPPPAGRASDLEQARQLADAGQLKEAAAVCEVHLKQNRASAPGWYLLGLVREAAGDSSASDCYRKALYLEPNHYESLLQLALLAEKAGDPTRARTYKRRAERCQNRGQTTPS